VTRPVSSKMLASILTLCERASRKIELAPSSVSSRQKAGSLEISLSAFEITINVFFSEKRVLLRRDLYLSLSLYLYLSVSLIHLALFGT